MRLRRPSHGTIVAYVALFAALGGTSYAAATLPRGSVDTRELAHHAVTRSKLDNGSVTGAKVRNNSLSAADFQDGSLPEGPAGPQGPAGPAGPAGPLAAIGYAAVSETGAVTGGSGITSANIIHNVAGAYCFTGLSKTPTTVQVTPQLSFFGPVTAGASLGAAGACPAGTQISVALIANSNNTAVNNGFFIEID